MLRSKWLGVMYAAATLTVLAPGTVSAQPADKRTFFTFSGNVEMPGVALPAGKYEFRIANPDSSRNVIQVRSGDGKKTFGLFLTHSSQRVTASNEAEVRFLEAGAGVPPAIKTWWYPGERTGYEFVYPKQQGSAPRREPNAAAKAARRGTRRRRCVTQKTARSCTCISLERASEKGEVSDKECCPDAVSRRGRAGRPACRSGPVLRLRHGGTGGHLGARATQSRRR